MCLKTRNTAAAATRPGGNVREHSEEDNDKVMEEGNIENDDEGIMQS